MKTRERPAHVYFILAQPSHRIKIGWAVDPQFRLKQLQTGSSDKLKLIGTISRRSQSSARSLESSLHKQFKSIRIDETEWFYPHPSLFFNMAKWGIIDDGALLKFCDSVKPPNHEKNCQERDKYTANKLGELFLKEAGQSDNEKEKAHSNEYYNYRANLFTESELLHTYPMGVANWDTRHILYLIWEAGHLLNCGYDSNPAALWILQQAVIELQREIAARK